MAGHRVKPPGSTLTLGTDPQEVELLSREGRTWLQSSGKEFKSEGKDPATHKNVRILDFLSVWHRDLIHFI